MEVYKLSWDQIMSMPVTVRRRMLARKGELEEKRQRASKSRGRP